jgi:hypothetical protein
VLTDENHLLPTTSLRQVSLESEPIESLQQFEHNASWAAVWRVRQELGGAAEDLRGVVFRREQIGETFLDRLLAIYNENARFQSVHASPMLLFHSFLCLPDSHGASVWFMDFLPRKLLAR